MRIYLIKKGSHYASMSFFEKLGSIGWNVKKLNIKFLFNPSCWWTPPRNQDDLDQNKLVGIGFGTNHHNNSVRLTWVPDFENPGMIRVSGYTYDERQEGQKFAISFIKTVRVEQMHLASIECKDSGYILTVDGVSVTMENRFPDPSLCFRLFPYFGGNNTAPQDMAIEMEIS